MNTVCDQVRWKQAHGVIRSELENHIEDAAEAHELGGMDAASAVEQAVTDMGDPVDIGLRMDASFRPAIAWPMLIPLGILMLIGVLMRLFVYDMTPGNGWPSFILAALMGGAGFVLLQHVNLYRAVRHAWLTWGIFLLFTLLIPPVWENAYIHQIKRLLDYNTVKYLWLLYPVVYGLLIYRLRGTGFGGLIASCALFGVPFLLSFNLIARYVTLSGMLCEGIGGVGCFAVLLVAIWNNAFGCNRYAAMGIVIVGTAIAVTMYCIVAPYRLYHVLSLFDPMRRPLAEGWQILRIREIVASLRPFGQGGALSAEAAALMRAFADNTTGRNYVFLTLMYRYGYAVMLVPIGCIGAFLAVSIKGVAAVRSTLGRMLSVGVVTVLTAQAALSLLACFGFPLWHDAFFPFLSYGGMSFLIDLLLTGLLASLVRNGPLFADTAYRRRRLRMRLDTE